MFYHEAEVVPAVSSRERRCSLCVSLKMYSGGEKCKVFLERQSLVVGHSKETRGGDANIRNYSPGCLYSASDAFIT